MVRHRLKYWPYGIGCCPVPSLPANAASLTAMAPGVAGALIATVVGLFVAIPAMFAYNFMVTKIRAFTQELDAFAIRYVTQIEHTYVDARPLGEEIADAVQRALKRQDYHAQGSVQAADI